MYPSTITTFTYPTSSDRLNSPSHSALHNTTSSAVGQIQAFIGTNASAVGTLIYDIRSPESNGGGHIQTANKGGTGQTQYNKGDILVAQSASVLTRLAVGTDGQILTADSSATTGLKWGVGGAPTVRIYSVAGVGGGGSSLVAIWTKPSNLSYAVIEDIGGGGGGGGTTTNGESSAGGGGGGYARKVVLAAALPNAASVILGRGGDGGAGTGGNGNSGGVTWFGSILSATGGGGGTQNANGGAGGIGVGGDINAAGSGGGGGASTGNHPSGAGGSTYFGAGAYSIGQDADGAPGSVFGGGGSGAKSNGSDRAGGAGAAGGVIITEY